MAGIQKINQAKAPKGDRGQMLLASGDAMTMRMWRKGPTNDKDAHAHDYEVLGYVVQGRAKIHTDEGATELEQGDSWSVPAGLKHRYEILEELVAVETTSQGSGA